MIIKKIMWFLCNKIAYLLYLLKLKISPSKFKDNWVLIAEFFLKGLKPINKTVNRIILWKGTFKIKDNRPAHKLNQPFN